MSMKRRRSTKDKSNKKRKHYEDDTASGSAYLDIEDLQDILDELKKFSVCNWRKFGLKAGLCNNTLDRIEANKTNVEDKFVECLSCWLRREDKVNKQGKPSWNRLAEILEELDRSVAREIKDRIRHTKEFSEISSRDPSETPQSYISDSETVNDDDKEYTEMQQQLSQILNSVIRRVPLEDIKMQLASWLAIRKISKGFDLMPLLNSYFSLSNLAALRDFVQRCKINDSTRKKLNKLLKGLSLRRNRFYEKILAKDFAKSEDHKTFDNNLIITFKVSWNEDEATLKDFDDFLSIDFKSNKGYIRLRVVHQSPLTFECSIPNCLEKEITDYVTKKKDQLIPKGVVEVTIDSTVIFNVERGYAALMFYEPNDMMTFTAVRSNQLLALLKYFKECHSCSEVGLIHYFHFESSHDSIELSFYQDPPKGWTIEPKDTKLMQADIDKFNGTDFSLHPCCSVTVRGSCNPKTEPVLHFPITLSGIKCPVTLFIHRILESTIPKTPIIPYTGIVYYERKKDNTYLMGFVAATGKKFQSIVDYIEDQHRIIKLVNFDFDPNSDIIKLNLQEISSSTWTAEPQSCELSKNEIDEALHDPPCRLISICRPPDAAQSVQYSLSLEGLTDPVSTDFKLDQTLHVNSYIGLVYYEWKKREYLMTFVAGKKLTKLIQYIHKHHEISDIFNFSFGSHHVSIELKFDTPQDHSCKGWTVQPLVEPCRLYQDDIDRFDKATYPLPPSCLISVYGSRDAVPTLHYSIPLEGVADPVTLFIDRKLQLEKDVLDLIASHKDTLQVSTKKVMELQRYNRSLYQELQVAHQNKVSLQEALLEATEQGPTTSPSSSNVVHELTAISSTGGASPSATVDVNEVKKVINDVLVSHYAGLNSLPKKSLTGLVNQLYTAKLISDEVRDDPSMKECIDEFKASLTFIKELPQVQEHCQKFLNSFIAVRGSYTNAAKALVKDIRKELGFDFIDIDD